MAQITHHGGCHCGAVRYRVDLDLTQPAIVCNCSICARTGTMLSFVPVAQFTLEQGEDHLTDYLFNKQVIHHLFCKTCGIRSFARGVGPGGAEMAAINVRCLDGVDLDQVPTHHYDGKSI
jgi:hypothetical protein